LTRNSSETGLNYPVLLFITIFPLSLSQPVSAIVDNIGRNSVWFLIPVLLLPLVGTWFSLQISRHSGNTSMMLACGEIAFRWLTPIAYIMYAILYLGVAAYNIALSGDFSSRVLQFGDSRTAIFLNIFISACAAFFPIETLTRYAQVIMVLLLPAFLALSLTMFMGPEWRWLLPLFSVKEMIHPVHAAAAVLCIFSPLATITLISRTNTSVSFLTLSLYLILLALLASCFIALSITTFGLHTARKMENLVFYAQNAIYIENFIFERFFYVGGVLLIYFKIVSSAFLMRCAALSLAHTFGVKLGFIPVLIVAGITAGMFWRINLPIFFHIAPIWIGYYSFLLIVVFPMLIYIISLMKGTKA
jgi:hypothetical protein